MQPRLPAARITVGHNRYVTEFAGHAEKTAHQFPVRDNGASDAGSQRQQDEVVNVASGADPFLAHPRGVGIVFENDRRPEPAAHLVPNRKVLERGKIVGIANNTFFKQDESRDGDADARQFVRSTSFAQRQNGVGHIAQDGFAAGGPGCLARYSAQQFARPVDCGSPQICSTQIETDGEIAL